MWWLFWNEKATEEWKREYRETARKEGVKRQVKREKERYRHDPAYRVNRRMKNAIGKCLNGAKAWEHWEALVGYSTG